MAPTSLFTLFLLSVLINHTISTTIHTNGIAFENFHGSGSHDDVEILILEEAQVVNTLIELDTQLSNVLDQVSSASGAVEIDVVVGESDVGKSGSRLWVENEIVVVIPAGSGGTVPRLSDEEKYEIKQEIEDKVEGALDAMIVDEAMKTPEVAANSMVDKVERLFEEEAEAEREIVQLQQDLKTVLETLPDNGEPAEIDIVVSTTDDEKEVEIVDEEIVVVIPAATGSGPRLMEAGKEELEEEIVKEAADALGSIILHDFVGDEETETQMPDSVIGLKLSNTPRLEEDSPRENSLLLRTSAPFAEEHPLQAAWDEVPSDPEPKPALRGAVATTTAHTGFEHPIFVPHHWVRDEQLWTMKLSMLTSISCLTLLLIVGVWTGVRRSRRRAVLDDSHFRWAEAVEYMDAFPTNDL